MQFFKELFSPVLNFLLPPTCPLCRKRVMTSGGLCNDCFAQIRFITPPQCACCGRPFEIKTFGENLCGMCLTKHPIYHKARSAFIYDDFSKKLILSFKHGDQIEQTPMLTNFLYNAGRELLDESDVIMPVPLHRFRLMKRKYNQAALLAHSLSRKTGKEYMPTTLKRVKHTQSQGHLKHAERKRNMSRAFAVTHADRVKCKRILLIDDVLTSGATVNECTKMLLKSGAKRVSVLTLARVLKE